MKEDRVFNELTPECDITAQMFALGLEKKEIADKKCRAPSTINNQIATAYKELDVRNGRELTIKYFERITGVNTHDLREQGRSLLSLILLCVFFVGFTQDLNARVRPRVRRVQLVRVVAVREY